MKIEKYTKLKNGQYKLTFDDNSNVTLSEDLILKHELLLHKEITQELLTQLLEENGAYLAYEVAINLLKTKMRSKKEMREYLKKREIDKSLIDNIIKRLEKEGYLNDLNYAKAFIHDRIVLSNDGPYKIKEKLLKLGVSEDIINNNLNIFDKELEEERISKLINKYTKANKNKSEIVLKKNLGEYLINLGYSKELVIGMVDKVKVNDTLILEREYDKVYEKLSKKYSGKELEYKVKANLYQKGFNVSDL